MIIYLVRNKLNGKGYVGLTINGLEARKKAHEYCALKGSKYPFHRALRKYGIDGFKWTILQRCYFKYNLKPREMYWIKRLKTKVPNGYNLTDGGDGCLNPSKELRELISKNSRVQMKESWRDSKFRNKRIKALKGVNKGRKDSKETKKKKSLIMKKRWKNKKYKKRVGKKISKSLTGSHPSKETIKILKESHRKENLSVEAIKNMSEGAKRRLKDPRNHPMYGVYRYGKDNPMYGRRKINGKWYSKEDVKKLGLNFVDQALKED